MQFCPICGVKGKWNVGSDQLIVGREVHITRMAMMKIGQDSGAILPSKRFTMDFGKEQDPKAWNAPLRPPKCCPEAIEEAINAASMMSLAAQVFQE